MLIYFFAFLTTFFAGLAAFLAAGFFTFLGDLAAFFAGLATFGFLAFFGDFAAFLAAGFLAFLGLLGFLTTFLAGFLAAFLTTFFLGFSALTAPNLKEPEAPVPLDCFRSPLATPLLRASFSWAPDTLSALTLWVLMMYFRIA